VELNNTQFAAVTIFVLGAHVAALSAALLRRPGPGAVVVLNALIAMAVLIYLGGRAYAFPATFDGASAALALFEVFVLAMAALAARRVRIGLAGSWFAFVLHFAASGLAVAFALLFRINRLI
jgi:hypothetical protein